MRIGGPAGARAPRLEDAVPHLVVLPLEVDPALAKEGHDDRERLLEAPHAVIVGDAEGVVLRLVPARSEPEDEAPARHLVERVRHLREDRGVPEAGARHERAEVDAARRLAEGRENRPGLPDPADLSLGHVDLHEVVRRRLPEQEVVGQEERVDADRFRRASHLPEVGPADGPSVAERSRAERKHETKPHPVRSCHALLLSINGDETRGFRRPDCPRSACAISRPSASRQRTVGQPSASHQPTVRL